jgi:ATP-binding cassette, subfamily B, bacterial
MPEGDRRLLLRRVAVLFAPYRWGLALLLLLIAVTVTLDLVALRLLGVMVDEMIPGEGDLGRLSQIFLVVATLIVASALLGVLLAYVNQAVGQGVMMRLRSDLHAHLQRLPVRFYTSTRTGEILSRISTYEVRYH